MSYIQRAMNFNKVVPQEKVYLHFDNMGYFENETMWFKAYVTRTDNRRMTDLSKGAVCGISKQSSLKKREGQRQEEAASSSRRGSFIVKKQVF